MENWAEGLRMEGVMGGEGVKQSSGPSRMVFTSFASSKRKEEMLRQVPGRRPHPSKCPQYCSPIFLKLQSTPFFIPGPLPLSHPQI